MASFEIVIVDSCMAFLYTLPIVWDGISGQKICIYILAALVTMVDDGDWAVAMQGRKANSHKYLIFFM